MKLGELIKILEKEDPNLVVKIGFEDPHSYRGDYSELAFEPAANITVEQMLSEAKKAINSTYEGWKGGEYKMSLDTKCHLAYWGCCGTPMSKLLLGFMLGKPQLPEQWEE